MKNLYEFTLKQIRAVIVGVVGFTLLIVGFLMIFLPGPAMVVIPLGLLILSTEFVWAKRLLKKAKDYAKKK